MATRSIRRVRSEEERGAGRGGYISLKKKGESFDGYALFVPTPDADKWPDTVKANENSGWYEFFQHYTPATGYFPCVADENGEGCPVCDMGDNPSTRCKVAFLIVDKDNPDPAGGEVKIFEMNWFVMQDFIQFFSEEEEPVLGQLFRVIKQEGNGKFMVRLKNRKLKANEIKAGIKAIPDIEEMTAKAAIKKMQDMDLEEAMMADDDDDDDDNEETTSKSKSSAKSTATKGTATKGTATKGKAKPADDDDDDDDDNAAVDFDPEESDEFEELVVTVQKADKRNNKLVVECGDATFEVFGTADTDLTGFAKGDAISVSAIKDEDGDFVVTSVYEASTDDDGDDDDGEGEGESSGSFDADEFEGQVTVVEVNGEEETLLVSTADDEEFELYFPSEGNDEDDNDWATFDVTDFSAGDKLTVKATKDEDGDMVADTFPAKARAARSKTAAAKKTTAKGRK